MKIVRFLGGLGNQMFQYAFYKSLTKKSRSVKADLTEFEGYALHNGFELERVFNIHLPSVSRFWVNIYDSGNSKFVYRKLRKLLGLKKAFYSENPIFSFDREILEDKTSKLYWGYWQNASYFKDILPELLNDFQFKEPLTGKNLTTLDTILHSESVALHVRRGDYLNEPLLGGICDLEYFRNAIAIMNQKVADPRYFVFSNDQDWCKANLPLSGATFVDWNQSENSYIDMQLMSNCKHLIISNSSFSWWAATLNNNPQKVIISPKRWVNDELLDTSGLINNTWITL